MFLTGDELARRPPYKHVCLAFQCPVKPVNNKSKLVLVSRNCIKGLFKMPRVLKLIDSIRN